MFLRAMEWALARFSEPTTWIGIIGGSGLALSGNLADAIGNALAAIMVAALVFVKERKDAK